MRKYNSQRNIVFRPLLFVADPDFKIFHYKLILTLICVKFSNGISQSRCIKFSGARKVILEREI